MKLFKSILVILFITLSFSSCKKPETSASASIAKKPIAANATIETASFEIDGMTCAIGCAKTIEKKLNETEGVKMATVDFDKKTGSVSYDVAIQTKEKLVKVIEAAADGTTYKVTNARS